MTHEQARCRRFRSINACTIIDSGPVQPSGCTMRTAARRQQSNRSGKQPVRQGETRAQSNPRFDRGSRTRCRGPAFDPGLRPLVRWLASLASWVEPPRWVSAPPLASLAPVVPLLSCRHPPAPALRKAGAGEPGTGNHAIALLKSRRANGSRAPDRQPPRTRLWLRRAPAPALCACRLRRHDWRRPKAPPPFEFRS
jgi:hypothetical protein